jgi:hypothetical protein
MIIKTDGQFISSHDSMIKVLNYVARISCQGILPQYVGYVGWLFMTHLLGYSPTKWMNDSESWSLGYPKIRLNSSDLTAQSELQ